MAFQQFFMEDWKSIPQPSKESEKTSSACFDCSICLDFARDPVVTLCGHLYCWPCIYEWFDSQNSKNEHPQCPVCKSEISEKTMVPLYGRGESLSEAGPEGKAIPPRPPACGVKGLVEHQLSSPNSHQSRHETSFGDDLSPPLFNLGGTTTVGMFGEMVYARVFGNSQSLYTYPNSYQTVVRMSPRLRRRELQADKSLNRVAIFLFCFFLLCLLVF